MKFSEYEHYKNLGTGGDDDHWLAITELFPHLNDHLLLVDEYEFEQISPCRLTTFTAKNPEQTQLYAIASDSGRIIIGKTEQLDNTVSLDLAEFDPQKSEIITLTISGQDDFLSPYLSLWVCVSRYSDLNYDNLLYHAKVGIDAQGHLRLMAVNDSLQAQALWTAQALNPLAPRFLNTWNFSATYGVDPFTMPASIGKHLVKLPASNTIRWLNNKLCYAVAKQVCLVDTDRPDTSLNLGTLTERASCLALKTDGQNKLHGLVGCRDYWLISFEEDSSDGLRECWRQKQLDHPVAISFTDKQAKDYELLILFSDGFLRKYHAIETDEIQSLWQHHWQQLGLGASLGFDAFLTACKAPLTNTRRSAACLYEILNRLFTLAEQASPKQRLSWLGQITQDQLFSLPHNPDGLPKPCINLLLQSLSAYANHERQAWPLPDHSDMMPALVKHLCHGQLVWDDTQLINQQIRTLEWASHTLQDPNVQQLIASAKGGLKGIWQQANDNADTIASLDSSDVALEYWANKFLSSDAVLFSQPLAKQGLVGVLGVRVQGQQYLLALKPTQVELYSLMPEDSRSQPISDYTTLADNDEYTQIINVYGNDAMFALLTRSGKVAIIELKEPAANPDLWQLSQHLDCANAHKLLCISWKLVSCPSPRDLSLLAIVGNEGRQAQLLLYQITPTGTTFLNRHTLVIHWLNCLDLSLTDNGYLLFVATDQAAIAQLYQLDLDFTQLRQTRCFNILRNGSLCVSFDKKYQPNYLLSGGYSGMLLCTPLSPSTINLCWSYQLEGFISQISALEINQQSYFLVSSGSGELCLLNAEHGRRCWKERLHFAIYQHCHIPSDKNLIALVLYKGRIKLFEQVLASEQLQAKAKIDACLGQLKLSPDSTIKNPCVYALHQILNKGEDAYDILAKTQGRRIRSRVLRYLIGTGHINSHKAMITQLSFRELDLSLSYTEQPNNHWRIAVWREIKRRLESPDVLPNHAINAAIVACLQHLSQEPHVNLTVLYDYRPSDIFLNKAIWVRLEYARLLVKIALDNQPEQGLLSQLLPYLLKLTPRLIYGMQVLFSLDHKNYTDFKALDTLLHLPTVTNPELLVVLETLIGSLSHTPATDKTIGLLRALASMQAYFIENTSEHWRYWRKDALKELLSLMVILDSLPEELPPPFNVFAKLSRPLKNNTLPADTETSKVRLAWIEKAKQLLDTPSPARTEPRTQNDWTPHFERLYKQTDLLIKQLLEKERGHLLQLVRPQLSISYQRLAGNKLNVELTTTPEGHRQLQDVTVLFDAGVANGLLGPGVIQQSKVYEAYSSQTKSETISLNGFISPEQTELCINVSLQDRQGYQADTLWSFPLPRIDKSGYQPLSLPTLLMSGYEAFKDRLFASDAPLTWVVCDEDLGAGQLLVDWDKHYPQQRLDLDKATHDLGAGRTYGATKLDDALLGQLLNQALVDKPRILLAPVEELLQRLLADDNSTTLSTWLSQLQQHQGTPILLLVSSLAANALQQRGHTLNNELCAHRMVIAELSNPYTAKPTKQQLLAMVSDKTGLSLELAEHYCRQFGFDLRLIMKWLQAFKQDGQLIAPQEFIKSPTITPLILAELQALDPSDLIAVLVGSRAITQLKRQEVQPGQIAAENYFSTPRVHKRKLLQRQNEAFTAKSLDKLHSDSHPLPYITVQGFAGSGAPVNNTPLAKLCTLVNPTSKLQRLAGRGLGIWKDSLFRTCPPYRNLILSLYEQETAHATDKDNNVYGKLSGSQHLPIEVITSEMLISFNNTEVQELMPQAKASDISKLRYLAIFWSAVEVDINALLNLLKMALNQDSFTNMASLIDASRWDYDLLSLEIACIGINNAVPQSTVVYPETYLFWLNNNQAVNTNTIKSAIDISTKKRALWLKQENYENYTPRIIITGPGSLGLPADSERRYARINFSDVCRAVWQGELFKGLSRQVKVQLRLTALSPFKAIGALPPGSPVFRGRNEELEFLKTRCCNASILIIGSRRVGKTSLLNQFYDWVCKTSDLLAIKVDLQHIKTARDFLGQLRYVDDELLADSTKAILSNINPEENLAIALPKLARQLQGLGKKVLFLLNEIDDLVKHTPSVITTWRSINEDGLARFIMTGYSVIGELGLPTSAFFHFTEGTYYGGKAIALTALSEDSARQLLDLLETSHLQLKWRSPEDKAHAYTLLLQRSYRIPWVLQSFGRLLVEQLEQQRQDLLTLSNVEKLLAANGDVVWGYIEDIRFEDFDLGIHKIALRNGIFVLLYALVRFRYFLGDSAPIQDKRLSQRNAIDLGFTVSEIHCAVNETINSLPILDNEKQAWQAWYSKLDLAKTLRLLTLTLVLEPDQLKVDRYAFLLHIFPLEVERKFAQKDPQLTDLLMDTLSEFLRLTKL